jgi:RNA polymerase sigma-70 factor (ECF subfamily)
MEAPPDVDALLCRLMEAAQQGDADAYAALLRAIAPIVGRTVRRRTRDGGAADADDVVQDVLLTVHQARSSYIPGRPFLPWLMALVRHRTADAARRQVRTATREVVIEHLDVTFAAAASNTGYDDPGLMDDLLRAVRALPEGQRQAVELLKLQEMSLKDAAVSAGTTVGALKVATHRAMVSLRRALVRPEHHED